MRIIDLYNMVANGEQPNKFKYKDRWFAYSVDDKEFRALKQEIYNGDYPEYVYLSELIDLSNLNDEIEVIEEPKKIEKISSEVIENSIWKKTDDNLYNLRLYIDKRLTYKVNEIIDYINSKEDK